MNMRLVDSQDDAVELGLKVDQRTSWPRAYAAGNFEAIDVTETRGE